MVGERRPSADIEDWRLTVSGLVADPLTIDLPTLLSLEHRELRFDIHCVTSWTRFDSGFTGIPLAEIVSPLPGARFVSFGSYSEHDHHTSLPVDYAVAHSWLVHEFEGAPLPADHGGPVRVVTPGKYFYKSIKWLRSVELLATDRLGWWETGSSYHNNADPFAGDERFTTGSIRPDQLARFKEAAGFDKYRGRVMLGLDLRGWAPKSRDLMRISLKNCDLRGVDLSNAELRHSNLSLSDLREARLAGADLSGSDLEGADFGQADLRGADLSHTALSATRFDGALLDGASFVGAWGLVEAQAEYLESQGVSLEDR